MMMSLLAVGVICGGITFFVLKIIPTWVVITLLALVVLFIIRPALRARRLPELRQRPARVCRRGSARAAL